ncbi:TetR/AcrR family transcriptional regulator [Streptomyces sp. 35G-GA-8]|uniref:TetR/AcrR family transcriptional regulator n=1 Tax=Streptomyces sp. 35G-GA-8 TaxID=2939434 RepID=UPI00201F827D|nr:TetR/AcrR family transcriptional regulator [Streptomyces sp. 35G-GA-8]MCL7376492.1 TetR/AcrR family transcriptional regulator [Streptomyces sp. 35G-GA-8]
MARPRTFDEDRALDAAMRTFWANGYEATSTQDLCEATGLGRSSIYNTFHSKRDLFRRSLTRYIDTMTMRQIRILEDQERPTVERIQALFDSIIEGEFAVREGAGGAGGGEGGGRSLGCLTVNTTVELAGRDPDADAILDRDLALRLASLRVALEAGQRAGEIGSSRDAGELARFLNAVIAGMRVSAQGGADRAALESVAAIAVDALRR